MFLRLAAVLSLASSGIVSAQAARDTARADSVTARLPDLVVRAPMPVATPGGLATFRARLDSMFLPGATVEDVFRTLPLLHLRRNSRGEAEVSLRGSDSRQVAVLVDGVPLTLSWDGRADLSVIPATAVREIDVTRGLPSMLHGPNVLGGVIEISAGQSLHQPAAAAAEIASEVDHIGGVGGKVHATVPVTSGSGRWLVRAGAGFRDTPGLPLAGSVVEPVPSRNNLRLNTDARRIDGFATMRYHSDAGAWVSVSGSSFAAERGVPAELGVGSPRFWRYPHVSRTVVVVTTGTGDRATPFGGRGDLEASLGVDFGRTEIDAYTSRTYAERSGFEHASDRTLTLRLLGDHTLGPRGDLRAAFTAVEIRHDESLPASDARYRQRLWSIGGETVWRVIESGDGLPTLRLSTGGAWDAATTPESGGREPLGRLTGWGLRAGATLGLARGTTLLHAGLSRRGRFPSLRELYSASLDRFAPNPTLRPEQLVALEAGITRRFGDGSQMQVVAFRNRMNDAVTRVTLPDGRFRRVNRNRLDSRGAELWGTITIGPARLGAELTVQAVDLTDTETEVTNRPENQPELFGGLRADFPLPLGARANAEARYTGTQFCIDPGTGEDTELAAGTVVQGGLARLWAVRSGNTRLFRRLETRILVENAGNATLFDQCGLPRAGRLVRVQVRVF